MVPVALNVRARELLIVLGEHAEDWFLFDDQLAVFQAWDDFTRQGSEGTPTAATAQAHLDADRVLFELKSCLRGLLDEGSRLEELLRYTRVLDAVERLHPSRTRP